MSPYLLFQYKTGNGSGGGSLTVTTTNTNVNQPIPLPFGSQTMLEIAQFDITINGTYDQVEWLYTLVGNSNPPTNSFAGSGVNHTWDGGSGPTNTANINILNAAPIPDPSQTLFNTNLWVEVQLTATNTGTGDSSSDTMVFAFPTTSSGFP